ncbi:MAG: DnaJ domain-containing protein [Candidatus Methylomirabilales bacterium]
MGTPFPSHYTRLGIEPTASREETRRAFRRAVKSLPPTGATDQWQEVIEAYRVLRDPISRRRYDARCRGRAWGRQILSRFPSRHDPPSRMRLVLWLGLATSFWALHWMIARGDRARKRPLERRRIALPPPQNRRGIAVTLLEAFGGDVRQVMAAQAAPEELARKLTMLLQNYRSTAASHLRDLERVALQMSRPCDDGYLDAVALMAIWGLNGEFRIRSKGDEETSDAVSRVSY